MSRQTSLFDFKFSASSDRPRRLVDQEAASSPAPQTLAQRVGGSRPPAQAASLPARASSSLASRASSSSASRGGLRDITSRHRSGDRHRGSPSPSRGRGNYSGSRNSSSSSRGRGNHSGAQGSSSRPGGAGNRGDRANTALAAVAAETLQVLPTVLPNLPHLDATQSESLHIQDLPPLKSSFCPGHTRPRIKIVNEDTFNAAIQLSALRPNAGRVAVLNMASDIHAGGGWLKGAVAQEEAMCYRSSLYLSLHKKYYPFRRRMGLYTPDVVIVRGDMASGHQLLVPQVAPADLPVVSVLSIAAIRSPEVQKVQVTGPSGVEETYEFARANDRVLTMDKMRLCLRMAASRGHELLVLGALGCGAFHNPPEGIARCWLEVLDEAEFAGGWWREVWFAVYDRKNEGNFEVFDDMLGGVRV